MEIKELSPEKQFAIYSFGKQAKELNEVQTKELLMNLYQQMVVRESIYKELMEHDWNGSILE